MLDQATGAGVLISLATEKIAGTGCSATIGELSETLNTLIWGRKPLPVAKKEREFSIHLNMGMQIPFAFHTAMPDFLHRESIFIDSQRE